MKVKSKVTFREYVNLLFGLTYQRPIMRFLDGVASLLLLWIFFYFLKIISLPEPTIYQYITLALMVIVQPIVIHTTIRRVYYSGNHICEDLEIEILPEEIRIQGESFYMEVTWQKMFKIVEKPGWFLIYHNSLSAIIIPKVDLRPDEVNYFRKILRDIRNVPVNLQE